MPGEVPNPYPYISQQVDCIPILERENINLILIDGCANDFDPEHKLLDAVVDPALWNDWGAYIDKWTHQYCHDDMVKLLRKTAALYPNADLIVPSYFPLISRDTRSFFILCKTLSALGLAPGGAGLIPAIMGGCLTSAAAGQLKVELGIRSERWASKSTAALRSAVETVKAEGANVWFAEALFPASTLYSEPGTWLWDITIKDHGANERMPHCRGEITCLKAAIFHPNPQGSLAYQNAMLPIVGQLLSMRAHKIDGALVREEGTAEIYVIYGGTKFYIPDPPTLQRLFGNNPTVVNVPRGTLAQVPPVPHDGTLIKELDGRIHVVYGGAEFYIPDPQTFQVLFGDRPVVTVPHGALAQVPPVPRDGTLFRELGNGKVYAIRVGTKYWIATPEEFRRLGLLEAEVRTLPQGSLNGLPDRTHF
jgi:hypothetical protein